MSLSSATSAARAMQPITSGGSAGSGGDDMLMLCAVCSESGCLATTGYSRGPPE